MGHVNDQQVLHVRGAELASGKAFSQVGRGAHLLRRYPTAQHSCAHVAELRLFLGMDSNVIAINVVGWSLRDRRIQPETYSLLEFGLKAFRSPSVLQE